MKQKKPFHVMIIPTLGCPSKCAYCWSSEAHSPVMSIETVKDIVTWLTDFRNDPVTFTFHGGEPLLAGADFYRQALPMLLEELEHIQPNFALQTNLWKLTPELAEVLAALVGKLRLIEKHPSYQSVWSMFEVHGGHYTGPNWKLELETAEALLTKLENKPG